MEDIKFDLSFRTVTQVQAHAGKLEQLNTLLKSQGFGKGVTVQDQNTACHIAWSKVGNISVTEFEHKVSKLKFDKELKDARHEVYKRWSALLANIRAGFKATKDPNFEMVDKDEDKVIDALEEWETAKPADEEAPELPPLPTVGSQRPSAHFADGSSIAIEEPGKIVDLETSTVATGYWHQVVSNKRNKKKVKPLTLSDYTMADLTDVPQHESHVVDPELKHPEVEASEVVKPSHAVFPATVNRTAFWIFEPGFSAPHVRGQRIKVEDVKNMGLSQVEWIQIKDPVYYRSSEMNVYGARAAFEKHLISPALYTIAVTKCTEDDRIFKDYTKAEAIAAGATETMLRCAELEYQKAFLIHKLTSENLASKTGFVEVWYDRLKDIATEIDSVVAGAAFKHLVLKALRQPGKGTAVNKCFYSFQLSQLAVWKKNKTKADVIKYSEPAVKCFWHDLSDKYIEMWKESPLASYELRTGYGRLSTRARQIYTESKLKTKSIIKDAKEMSSDALNVAATALKEEEAVIEALSEGLSFKDRLKLRFQRGYNHGKKLPGYLKDKFNGVDTDMSGVKGYFSPKVSKMKEFFRSLWYTSQPAGIIFSANLTEEGATDQAIEGIVDDEVPTRFNKIISFIPRKIIAGLTSALRWAGAAFNASLIENS